MKISLTNREWAMSVTGIVTLSDTQVKDLVAEYNDYLDWVASIEPEYIPVNEI